MNERFLNYLETLPIDTLISLWNQYAIDESPEDYIWDNIEAYIKEGDESKLEIAKMMYFGQIDDWEDKVYLDFLSNFRSFNESDTYPIYLEALAEWLEEAQHDAFLNWQSK